MLRLAKKAPAQKAHLENPRTWRGAMEATLFSGWIYDTLQPYGEQLEMAHPAVSQAGLSACLRPHALVA
jgi:hypothetical protein